MPSATILDPQRGDREKAINRLAAKFLRTFNPTVAATSAEDFAEVIAEVRQAVCAQLALSMCTPGCPPVAAIFNTWLLLNATDPKRLEQLQAWAVASTPESLLSESPDATD